MARTLATMRTNLTRALGNRGNLTTTEYDQWVNDGYFEMANRLKLTELQRFKDYTAIIDPTNTIAYTIDALAVLDLRDKTNDEDMRYEEIKLLKRRAAQTQDRGFTWSGHARVIHIHPTPKSSTQFTGLEQFRPALLTSSNLTPEIDDAYRYGIELIAQVHAWRDLRDPDRADQILLQFREWADANNLTALLERRAAIRRRSIRPRHLLNLTNPRLGV